MPRITTPPALVTVTMGGNDLMLAYGDTDAAYAAADDVIAAGEEILTRLTAARTCHVVFTTVYDPSDGTGYIPSSALPLWPQGPSVVLALNTALARLANRHDAVLADVHTEFLGHGASVGDPAQPEARPANHDLWYCGVIEPNAWGAHQIRTTWWQALHDSGWRPGAERR